MTAVETPVLIVGGGPVGLSLAIDLSWRDVPCVLIEQGDGSVVHPKVGHISMRTMEFVRRWGLVQEVRNCGFPADYALRMVYCTTMNGHRLCSHEFPSMRDAPTPHYAAEKKQRCPQMWFDPILAAALKRHERAKVLYNHRLLDFEQNDSEVIAHIQGPDKVRDIRSKYLVACDGANSGIRQALGIGMEGNPILSRSIAIYFRSPELLAKTNQGPAERYTFVGPEGTWGNLTAVDGDQFWRLTVYGSSASVDVASFDAAAWVRRCLAREDIGFDILSVLPWRRSQLVAEKYQAGRIFIAGDAAHTMSPTGGFGMNTGIGDAVDLGWKLEASLNGWGGANLLASYESERKPIGRRNADFSAGNYYNLTSIEDCSEIEQPSARGAEKRVEIGAQLKAATLSEYESAGVILGYRYEESPICVPDGAPAPPDLPDQYIPAARPGSRAPHFWLSPDKSVIDLFGRGFVLLRFKPVDTSEFVAAAERQRIPLQVHSISDEQGAALYERNLVLVRPDGHVAWRADCSPEDPSATLSRVTGAH